MSAIVESWLQKAISQRGVLACGVRLADRTFLIRTNRDELSPARIEQAMKKLGDAVQAIQQNQLPADRLCWTFESGEIICSPRAGGVIVALFVNKDIAKAEDMDKLLATFKAE
ncbi:MAG TPA: hypothetical protein VK327_18205 [Candidatus Paceibacterota bacterium]|nr:hypothetical protein [Candidatus Paceibacterota bacterium]